MYHSTYIHLHLFIHSFIHLSIHPITHLYMSFHMMYILLRVHSFIYTSINLNQFCDFLHSICENTWPPTINTHYLLYRKIIKFTLCKRMFVGFLDKMAYNQPVVFTQCTYTYTYRYIHVHVFTYMYIYKNMYMYVHVYVHVHVHISYFNLPSTSSLSLHVHCIYMCKFLNKVFATRIIIVSMCAI